MPFSCSRQELPPADQTMIFRGSLYFRHLLTLMVLSYLLGRRVSDFAPIVGARSCFPKLVRLPRDWSCSCSPSHCLRAPGSPFSSSGIQHPLWIQAKLDHRLFPSSTVAAVTFLEIALFCKPEPLHSFSPCFRGKGLPGGLLFHSALYCRGLCAALQG